MNSNIQNAWPIAIIALLAIAAPWIGVATAAALLPHLLPNLQQYGLILAPAYITIASLLVGLALAPTHLTSLIAGYIFGLPFGLLSATATVAIGATIGFIAAKKLAQDQLRNLLNSHHWGRTLLEEMLDSSPKNALLTITLARLPPQVPFAVGNLLSASIRAPILPFIAGTITGMFPRVALVVLVGSQLAEWTPGAPIPSSLFWTVIATLIGLGALTLWGASILHRKQKSLHPTTPSALPSQNPP